MTQSAAHDILTRGPGELILDVLVNPIARPVSEGADARRDVSELGDKGVMHVNGRGQMADQRLEEFLTRAAGGPFDQGTEGAEVILQRCCDPPFPFASS